MGSEHCPKEKMVEALSVLAAHPGGVKERLNMAFLRFAPIAIEDAPEQCTDGYRCIVERLAKDDKVGAPSAQATLEAISEQEAVEVARRICGLAHQLMKRY